MGYAHYTLPDGREAGYGVAATCDADGCTAEIDRGLGYLCGQEPDGWRAEDDPGCGRYFCAEHESNHNCPNPWGTPHHAFVEDADHQDGDEQRPDDICWFGDDDPHADFCGAPRHAHGGSDDRR